MGFYMLGHYIGDPVINTYKTDSQIIGIIIGVPYHPSGLFRIGWSDGRTNLYDIREVRQFKYYLEDRNGV